ncbi:unnamed protein product [Linum trigynum]|uniref:Uncharacterized protein n=1 Tax=Linum trigynum TaxID=586398 RepID=A0AAV2FIE5_9ROSI
MAAGAAPVAIGTRGTVGALVRKEIEYFTNLEHLDPRGSCLQAQGERSRRMASRSSSGRSFWPLRIRWGRKKAAAGGVAGGLIRPGMCSAVDVARDGVGISGRFGYRVLKQDDFDTYR